jgi:hypothetical protein
MVTMIFLAAAFAAVVKFLPVGLDWRDTYRPAALAMLRGESPFSVEIYYAAPWALIPLMPFALMPYAIGRAGVFVLGLAAFAFTAHRMGARGWVMVVFLCSAAVVGCLNNGNIEWMPLLGIVLPPQLGLVLLAVKPQVGVGLGLFWMFMIWRSDGPLKVLKTFAPVTVLLLISFALYGLWPLRFEQTIAWSADNTSLGWYGMALGWAVLMRAIRKGDEGMALASGPLLAPYVLQFTWSALLVYLLKHPLELAGTVAILWVPVILRVIRG